MVPLSSSLGVVPYNRKYRRKRQLSKPTWNVAPDGHSEGRAASESCHRLSGRSQLSSSCPHPCWRKTRGGEAGLHYPDGCMSSHFRPQFVRTRPETPGNPRWVREVLRRGSSDTFMQLICALLPVPAQHLPFSTAATPSPLVWVRSVPPRGIWKQVSGRQEPPAVTLGTTLSIHDS